MMSQTSTPGPGQPDQLAPLERLPPELLLPIVTSLPGLDTLWNLMRASPSTFRLFDHHAIAITEGILSGPCSILPSKVQELVRGVILARSETLPFKNIFDFQVRFMCGLSPFFRANNIEVLPLDRGTLLDSKPRVAVLRSIVVTAYQLSALSQAFLASCLEQSRALTVLHPLDPNISYEDECSHPSVPIPAVERDYRGAPAKMVDAGQPTWVEEMRAVRAFWIIQALGEMQCFFANKANTMDWSDEDINRLNNTDPVDLFRVHRTHYEGEEIRSAMAFVRSLGEPTDNVYYRLPRAPPASPTTRWITASPMPKKINWVVGGYSQDRQSQPSSPGSPVSEGVNPLRAPRYSDEDRWGKTEPALRAESFGVTFFRTFRELNTAPVELAIPCVKFDSFRPLGFAFWDQHRMHLLGLAPEVGHCQMHFYFFAWESILPLEEAERLKSMRRELLRQRIAHRERHIAAMRAYQGLP